ncbi:MAG: hypothetical protein EOP04_14515 [Proteobacteria bacterium]|nr:MAG: hypothetical protein EOP04_14515 [Pseudomonadota bacterium]
MIVAKLSYRFLLFVIPLVIMAMGLIVQTLLIRSNDSWWPLILVLVIFGGINGFFLLPIRRYVIDAKNHVLLVGSYFRKGYVEVPFSSILSATVTKELQLRGAPLPAVYLRTSFGRAYRITGMVYSNLDEIINALHDLRLKNIPPVSIWELAKSRVSAPGRRNSA